MKNYPLLIDIALEECWQAEAEGELFCPEDMYFIADEAREQGIGAVLVPNRHGSLKWFCLETLKF